MNVNDTLIPQGPQDHLKVLGSRLVSNTTWPCPGGRAARILAASSPMEPIMTSATQLAFGETVCHQTSGACATHRIFIDVATTKRKTR